MTIKLIFLKFIILRSTRDLRGKKEKAVQPEVDQMQLVTIISEYIQNEYQIIITITTSFEWNLWLYCPMPDKVSFIYIL